MTESKYVAFKQLPVNQNKKEFWFKNELGPNPYYKEKTLYIPIEMLNSNYFCQSTNNYKPINEEREEKTGFNLLKNLLTKEPSGLVNIGGVCYMNAVLQCFFHCKPLTNYFLNLDNVMKNSLGLVSNGYYELVKGLSLGDSRAAFKFKQAMISTDDTFVGNEGKDSKDVAILILTELHNELKENDNSFLYYDNKVNPYDKVAVFNEKEKLEKINGNNTIISDTFHFLVLYEQQCRLDCKNYFKTLYSVETENIIIFELEKIYNDIHKNNYSYQRYISVQECLEHYISKEIIDCPFCKMKSLKIRKSFCKLPKIFIFVLSRGLNAQFDCNIIFKNQLDMKPYYEPINGQYKDNNTNYELIGATFAYDWSHRGDGHTVAFCRSYKSNGNYPQYYVFNDSSTRKTDIKEINGKIPYLLFYAKKNLN